MTAPGEFTMYFGGALKKLRAGQRVARRGWRDKGMWLALFGGVNYMSLRQDRTLRPLQPFIVIKVAEGGLVPWVPSQTCVLADDWVVVP